LFRPAVEQTFDAPKDGLASRPSSRSSAGLVSATLPCRGKRLTHRRKRWRPIRLAYSEDTEDPAAIEHGIHGPARRPGIISGGDGRNCRAGTGHDGASELIPADRGRTRVVVGSPTDEAVKAGSANDREDRTGNIVCGSRPADL